MFYNSDTTVNKIYPFNHLTYRRVFRYTVSELKVNVLMQFQFEQTLKTTTNVSQRI